VTVVVGHAPHKGGRGALDLGLALAHARDEAMAVVTVVPRQWTTPSLARIDAEYAEYARQVGEYAEQQARGYLTDTSVDVPTAFRATTGRSVPSALIAAVDELDAGMLVVGSSVESQVGRIVAGSTAEKLLHSCPVPLAISPREYRSVAAAGFTRITCAFSDSSATGMVSEAAALAARVGAGLRVASFGVRGATMYPPEVGLSAEDSVLDSWVKQAEAAQQRLVAEGVVGPEVQCVVATGSGWGEALSAVEWRTGELLVLGSSPSGALARVFLGSRARKLIRYSPVPVIVLPGYPDV
jgi:nucleotide-binding universal stress UspA family protein